MSKQAIQINPTLIDRVVNYFSPQAGNARFQARAVQAYSGSYNGASRSKRSLSKWFTRGGSADADLNADLPTLRNRSRDLYRNDGIARGAINSTVTNVVGTGLAPQPAIWADVLGMTDDEVDAWQRDTLREFTLWAEKPEACDLTGIQNFYGLQDLAFRSVLINGDHGVLLPERERKGVAYKLKLQMIEADRICNKNGTSDSKEISAGIQLDDDGMPVGYWVMTRHPGDGIAERNWQYVSRYGSKTGRRNMLHLYERLRSDQRRGEPYLAPIIELLKQLSRYTEAELMAAVISGMFTVFVTTDPANGDDDVGDEAPEYALGNGAIITGMPGDKPEIINPGRPNALFDPFVEAISKQIGIALEIPKEVLFKHFTSSYTAARASLLDAWRFYRKRRSWLAAQFCQPIYETWLDEAVASGRIYAPGYFADPLIRAAYQACVWVGDAPGAIDPLKEAQADKENLAIGKTTLSKVTMAYDGSDWRDNHRQQVKEKQARERDGLLIESGPAPAQVDPPDADLVDDDGNPIKPANSGLF